MNPALAAALGRDVTAVALNWKLTRPDGLVLGFTSHDRDLWLDGVTYHARPGMTPSAVSQSAGFDGDSMGIEGVLDSGLLTGADFEAGRWAGARLELFLCDWTDLAAGQHRLVRGRIGDVAQGLTDGTGVVRIELVSEMAAISALEPLRCSPLCRAELGDGRCGVDMAGRSVDLVVLAAAGDRIVLEGLPDGPDDYAQGRLRLLTGPLAGLDRRVARLDTEGLWLEEPIWTDGVAGARLRLWAGCDKRLATCAGRFANAVAFDGEPHLPGTDALIRYGDA